MTAPCALQENEIWKLIKSDREKCATLVAALGGLTLLLAGMLAPFLPGRVWDI